MTPTDETSEGSGGPDPEESHALVRNAAEQLYAGAPGEFIDTRTALVKSAKAQGDKDAAKEIAALRRPSTAAWVLNQLVHRGDPVVGTLADLGARLRQATAHLDAPALARMRKERDAVLDDLVTAAAATASDSGQTLTAAVSAEVRDTGIAALADEAAEAVLASGTLTRALSYSGFGEVDLSEAAATTSTGVVLTSIRGGRAAAQRVDRVAAEDEGAPDDRAVAGDRADAGDEGPEREAGVEDDAGTSPETGAADEAGAADETGTADETGAAEDAGTDDEAGAAGEGGAAGQADAEDEPVLEDEAEDGADALAEGAAEEELERRRAQAEEAVATAQKEIGRRRAAVDAARNRSDATRQRIQKLEDQLARARAEDDDALEKLTEAVSAAKRAASTLSEAENHLATLRGNRDDAGGDS
ncbi:hypothetical protein [Ornithinimicrobium cavernae]|uniref:hypothetical protein n=1 Tax=Ornithinimicrobium cavernae TaxID=2666047 RepID=UPI000D6933BC|nr:hypothetical protein [Ornithinimicrobium cavernae]